MFCIKGLARPDRWIWDPSCSPSPAPSVPLRSAVEMPLWSPVIPTAREAGTTRPWLASFYMARQGRDGILQMCLCLCTSFKMNSRCPQLIKPQAGPNVLLPPQRLSPWKIKYMAVLEKSEQLFLHSHFGPWLATKIHIATALGINVVSYFPHMLVLGQYCLGKNSDVKNQSPVPGSCHYPEYRAQILTLKFTAWQSGQGISSKIKKQQCF